jgi:dynein light chain Tctex-type 1
MSDCLVFGDLIDDVNDKAQIAMSSVLENKQYSPSKVTEWIDQINGTCIEHLKKISPNFKYIVNCFIQQKIGAGLHYECVTHWDGKHDGSITAKFENDTIICVVVIFGISL